MAAPGGFSPARIQQIYARALRLYPRCFRDAYSEPMRQALRDTLADPGVAPRTVLRMLIKDLIASLIKEHIAMLRDTFGRPALIFNAVVLSGMATLLGLALYAIPQQVLRQGANDPQIQMATDMAAILERYGVTEGLLQGALMKSDPVDLRRSLSPFLIVYDDKGLPLGSTGQLDGLTPTLPRGVLDYVRQHGEERVSWQPMPGRARGVRVAAVVERVGGRQPGFVLAGRSLREVEAREQQVADMARLAWVGMLGLIVLGTVTFGWYTRPKPNRAALHSPAL